MGIKYLDEESKSTGRIKYLDDKSIEQPEFKDSMATQGVGYIKEHPFKSTFQGLPETITGKSTEQRAIDQVQSPDFASTVVPQHKEGMPYDAGLDQVRTAAENRIVGGQMIDMASAPANLMGPVLSGIGKVTGITNAINTLGKPLVAKTMSVFSGIPERDVLKAVDNPNILSNGWLKQEKKVVTDIYQNKITPAIQDLSNRVDTAGLASNLSKEIKLANQTEPTRLATTMNDTSKEKVIKWLDDLKTGDISLNKLDSMIGEIDESLGKVYRKMDLGKTPPVNTTLELIGTKIRGALKEARDAQYPDLAPLWARYSDYKNAERISQSFNKWYPRLSHVTGIAGMLGTMGLRNPAGFGVGVAAAIPKVQGLGIELGGALSKVPSIIPAQAGVAATKDEN